MNPKEGRAIVINRVRKELIGPGSDIFLCSSDYSDEIIEGKPLQRYFSAILFPKQIQSNPEDNGSDETTEEDSLVEGIDLVENESQSEVTPITDESLEEDENHSYTMDDSSPNERLSKFIDLYTEHCSQNLTEIFPKIYDAQIADAILELFRKRENLDIFNKKALYIYIREIVDVKTPKITKIANQLYDIFKKHYFFYLEHGYTNF